MIAPATATGTPRTAWIAVGTGVACLLGAAALAVQRAQPAHWEGLRQGARPLVLPFVWQALGDADRSIDRTRWQSRARLLMEFLPEWTDGHLLFATQEALEPASSPNQAAERLAEALGWMGSIVDQQRTDLRSAEVLATMASLIDTMLMTGDDTRRSAMQSALGRAPEDVAQGYRERAAKLDPSAATSERRIFGQTAVLRGALKARDIPRARRLIRRISGELNAVRDREIAEAWQSSLEILDRWLVHGRKEDLEAIRTDPMLEDIALLLER